MDRLTVELGDRSYPILIGPGLLADGGLLDRHVGHGYALEAAQACLAWARGRGLARVVAIVRGDNQPSIRLLERLGMRYERLLPADATGQQLALYGGSTAPLDQVR